MKTEYRKLIAKSFFCNVAMCQLALKFMKSEPEGDHAKLARALWTPSSSDVDASYPASLLASYGWSAIYVVLAIVIGAIGTRAIMRRLK